MTESNNTTTPEQESDVAIFVRNAFCAGLAHDGNDNEKKTGTETANN
ncbi:hypothetical protein [Dysgonomonas reticulitermitis]